VFTAPAARGRLAGLATPRDLAAETPALLRSRVAEKALQDAEFSARDAD